MTDSARKIVEQMLRRHASGDRYAMIDYPGYANPGDSAIWCGARVLLEAMTGRPPSYVSTLRHFDAGRCRQAVSGGTVFFLGGGNFGSLYGKHQRMRLRALEQLRSETIVLLPLSVADGAHQAGDPALAERTTRVMRQCTGLTVLARERLSQAMLRDVYGVEADLCPDTAHGLTLPSVLPQSETVALRRSDRESLGGPSAPPTAEPTFDWEDDALLRWINRAGKLAPLVPSHGLRLAAFDALSRRKVAAACALLGRGRTVRTDRLHGVILASLMGRTVLASDNATGKVGSYIETWAGLLPRVLFSPHAE